MALLNVRPFSVSDALSVAENRASKCRMLRREGNGDIADKYAESLFYDVREWIGSTVEGTNASDDVCARLHEIVASAR